MIRKFLGLLLASFLIVIVGTGIFWQTAAKNKIEDNYAQKLWESHQNDRPIATPMVTQNPTVPITEQTVTYGTYIEKKKKKEAVKPIIGYLARPSQTIQDLPALIVIHEWWGLNDNIKMMTQRLAGEGYTALAVDLYGGQVANDPTIAAQLVTQAQKDPRLIKENLRQAYKYLETMEKAPKIGSIGWCFGGTWSLNTALLFPQQLDAAVIYYGSGIETNTNVLKPLQVPILGIFGQLDQNPPVAKVEEFQEALESLGKSAEIHIYENANHAFANPSGNRYNPEAAEDAWEKTTAFLEKHLKS